MVAGLLLWVYYGPMTTTNPTELSEKDEIRGELLFDLKDLLENGIEATLAAFSEGPADPAAVLDFLKVELGLAHPRGPHHLAPGLASALETAR